MRSALAVIAIILSLTVPQTDSTTLTNGQGEMAGEVTTSSVILQSRLTSGRQLVNGDLPGAAGVARFELSTTPQFQDSRTSVWLPATAGNDFIVKTRMEGLMPGTRYYYRLLFGPNEQSVQTGPVRSFKTLPGPGTAAEVNFVVVTGMNYQEFKDDDRESSLDKQLGYPALQMMLDVRPDFFIGTGDNVYYDIPQDRAAKTQAELRKKWHEQFAQPRFADFFGQVATYWEKDDHDYRFDDADNTGEGEPSVALAIATFQEQLPVDRVPYRTHRVSRDLQIWLTESREYRSPNMMPDGPDKTLWGAEQLQWLKRTLLESNAAFKILISPTPMVGPDDLSGGLARALKRDNHIQEAGFRTEGNEFIRWLNQNGFFRSQNFFIITGDRHWQYHSIHPSGLEEFSSGAIVDGNSRLGRKPGDPASTDPQGLVKQPYTQTEASGGFLRVTTLPGSPAKAIFRWYDDRGALLHTVEKSAR
jgi:alkaline phosphatase/alkaline phosphatase D